MIGKLWGRIDTISGDGLILQAGHVGYDVACSGRTLANLAVGDEVAMIIETHVREDQIKLFGFSKEPERDMFRLLQTVQGVGTKVALAIMSLLSTSEIAGSITLADKAMITRTPGVGPKLAERIIVELKGKVLPFTRDTAIVGSVLSIPAAVADAISALSNLGYSREQATLAVSKVAQDSDADAPTEKLIRLGLRELSV